MRYKPNTPPPKGGYPMVGKTTCVMADLLARCFGLEKPEFKLEPVSIAELNHNKD